MRTKTIQMLESGQNDLAWFESSLEKLQKKYNNKFIAFRNKEVLSYDTDLKALIRKLKQKGIDTSNVFIKFVAEL